jgi:hypothetical protein
MTHNAKTLYTEHGPLGSLICHQEAFIPLVYYPISRVQRLASRYYPRVTICTPRRPNSCPEGTVGQTHQLYSPVNVQRVDSSRTMSNHVGHIRAPRECRRRCGPVWLKFCMLVLTFFTYTWPLLLTSAVTLTWTLAGTRTWSLTWASAWFWHILVDYGCNTDFNFNLDFEFTRTSS